MELSSGHTVSSEVRNPTQTILTLKPGYLLVVFAAQENISCSGGHIYCQLCYSTIIEEQRLFCQVPASPATSKTWLMAMKFPLENNSERKQLYFSVSMPRTHLLGFQPSSHRAERALWGQAAVVSAHLIW